MKFFFNALVVLAGALVPGLVSASSYHTPLYELTFDAELVTREILIHSLDGWQWYAPSGGLPTYSHYILGQRTTEMVTFSLYDDDSYTWIGAKCSPMIICSGDGRTLPFQSGFPGVFHISDTANSTIFDFNSGMIEYENDDYFGFSDATHSNVSVGGVRFVWNISNVATRDLQTPPSIAQAPLPAPVLGLITGLAGLVLLRRGRRRA